MKKTIRENINMPYSLHDMTVIEFAVTLQQIISTMNVWLKKKQSERKEVD